MAGGLAAFGRGAVGVFDSIRTVIFRHYGPSGVLARTWLSGQMVLWVAILLLMYLVLFYVPG